MELERDEEYMGEIEVVDCSKNLFFFFKDEGEFCFIF